jgi:hypothetical protein
MSRSYREPYFVDGYGSKWKRFNKNYANRRVRRKAVDFEIADGNSYRRMYDQWDICDWRFRYDPRPRYYSWGGELRVSTPEPEWKIRSK